MVDANVIIATHAGAFDAGEVFSAAVLQTVFPGATIFRGDTERVETYIEDPAAILLNTGGLFNPEEDRFDTTGQNIGARPDGVAYGLFGTIWNVYGRAYALSRGFEGEAEIERVIEFVDAALAQPIDVTDKGSCPSASIMAFVNFMNPTDGTHYDVQFSAAVRYIQGILHRYVRHALHM